MKISKTKKTILGFLIGLIISIGSFAFDRLTFGKPSNYERCNLYKQGDSEIIKLGSSRKLREIGFFAYSSDLKNGFGKWDGNFTVEYLKNNTVIKTKNVTLQSIKKVTPKMYIMYTSSGYASMPLDVYRDKSVTSIRITVNKHFSNLKNYTRPLYIYYKRYINENPGFDAAKEEKEKIMKSSINDNETNSSLLNFRHALDNFDTKLIKKIISNDTNISVNTSMLHDRHPLHYAAHNNDISTVSMLIKLGADIFHRDRLEKNALAYAIENNATKTVKLLLDNNMSFSDVDFVQQILPSYSISRGWESSKSTKMLPLPYAVSIGSYELVQIMLENNETRQKKHLTNNVYSYMYHIPNFKQILSLLEKYKVKSLSNWKPSIKTMHERLERCSNNNSIDCEPANTNMNVVNNPLELYFSIVQHQTKLSIKRDYEKLEDKYKDNNNPIVTNGFKLPNKPNYDINNQTLAGIDSNKNGIRDDAERYIYANFKKQINREIAMQMAKAQQTIFTDTNIIKNADIIHDGIKRAKACQIYLQHRFKYPKYMNYAIDQTMKRFIFNNVDRSRKHWEWKNTLTTDSYRIPQALQVESSCDFDTYRAFAVDRNKKII